MGAVSLLKGIGLRGVNVGWGKVQEEGVGVIWRGCVGGFESSVSFGLGLVHYHSNWFFEWIAQSSKVY